MPSFNKSGRWTYAEQRALIEGLRKGQTVELIARELGRSASSAHQKAREFGLDHSPVPPTESQVVATAKAARQRALSEKCKALALLVEDAELVQRLNAMAVEYYEQAWATEAKAGLRLTREPSTKRPRGTGSKAP